MTTWRNTCGALAVLLLLAACGTGKDKVADTATVDEVSEVTQDGLGGQDAVADSAVHGDVVSEDGIEEPDACQPNCEDKECGDDGCGGECGICSGDQFCANAHCHAQMCAPGSTWCEDNLKMTCAENGGWPLSPVDCEVTEQYCFDGECIDTPCPPGYKACDSDFSNAECIDDGEYLLVLPCPPDHYCESGECVPGLCSPAEEFCVGDVATTCTSKGDAIAKEVDCTAQGLYCQQGKCVSCQLACAGVECGPDGCGGVCGECGCGEECLAGTCLFTACQNQECGDDGCGGACGGCAADGACLDDFVCETACTVACEGKQCGPDCCGGYCGLCPGGLACTDDGQCVGECKPVCGDAECGGDGCGGLCGACIAGGQCVAGICTVGCVPDCELKECGPDGCLGSCGECPGGLPCTGAGACGGPYASCPYTTGGFTVDFDDGSLASWDLDGAKLTPGLGGTVPPSGDYMLQLMSGVNGKAAADLSFCLPAGSYSVSLFWRFYSEEFKEWCGSDYQDGFLVTLETDFELLNVVAVTIDQLCPAAECLGCGEQYGGLTQSDVAFDQGDVWNIAWRTGAKQFNLPADDTLVTLHLEAFSAVESLYFSLALADEIRILPCVGECLVVECGPDPCTGNICGTCGEGAVCFGGQCCVPECGDGECGSDGCGGNCGGCVAGKSCVAGTCQLDLCLGLECGPDGFGGNCGFCTDPEESCLSGACVCTPICQWKECGPDGCGGSCGECLLPGQTCSMQGQCE